MKHKNWQRTEELFQALVGMGAEERAVYLAQACPEDASLRAEVESLIAAFDKQPDFMEKPAFSLGMKVLSAESNEQTLVGKQVGPYEILMLLGKGGMGEVYLARDTRLDRQVALKFLSNRFVNDAWAKRQLMKEAQAVAKLDHPNICAIYGFEEYDGYNFMVMQYIEGETLASLIRKGLLEPKQIPSLALQIVSALAEAHSHGILHRDIKPQNIMVLASGQAKVLDFGLAKFVQQRQDALGAGESESKTSQLGLILGTVAYMSPEQLRAERLDFRSDIFSFGIVLYEMLSGRNPYLRASNAEVISAILTSDPPPLTDLAADVPAGLARVTQKCLERDREQRYQSASELLLVLDNPPKERTSRSPWRGYYNLRNRIALALILSLVIAGSFAYLRPAQIRTLAVLPIVNNGINSNAAFLSEGLTESLGSRLSRLSELRVKVPTFIPAYNSEDDAQQRAGRDFNVDAVLLVTLTTMGESLTLHVKLVNAADGLAIWQQEYNVKPAELPRLQEELAYSVASKLQPSLNDDERKALAVRHTDNAEAYKLYLLGRHYWRKRDSENIQKAIKSFNQAIELDPLYAQAHARLADCYVLLNSVAYGSMTTEEAMSKARAAAIEAIQIDDTLCEAHTSLGVVKLKYEWNWKEAQREFKRAINLDPSYAPAHFWYSQLLALTGHTDESIAESEIAREQEPFSPLSDMNYGRALYLARQYDKAINHFGKILQSDPNDKNALYMLGLLYLQNRLYKESIQSLEKLYALRRELAAGPLGYAYAKAGRRAQALEMLDALEEIRKEGYVSAQEKALIYMGLDDKDKAFFFFMQACQEKAPSLPFIKVDPLFDSIRSDPRYLDLARCANIL